MTQEEKELLFKELSIRHPYNVKLQVKLNYGDNGHKEGIYDAEIDAITSYNIEVTYYDTNMHGEAREWTFMYEEVKPYLRSMSSMTEEEKRELQSFYPGSLGSQWIDTEKGTIDISECSSTITLYLYDSERIVDWLNKNMFDYRGLIDKGLALEAPEGMYNIKKK